MAYIAMNEDERIYLEKYDPNRYERYSATADMLIFTVTDNNKLGLVLIQRGRYPYKGKWAFPGGFVSIDESIEDAAIRELKEETGLTGIYMDQIGTYGAVDRDPRMRVISIAHYALVPMKMLKKLRAGDDANKATIFEIDFVIRDEIDGDKISNNSCDIKLKNVITEDVLDDNDLAFDHSKILFDGINKLKEKFVNSDIVFELVTDKNSFTLYEVRKIYEAVLGKTFDTANFRRDFTKKYINTRKVIDTGEKSNRFSPRPSKCYRVV